MRVPAGPADWSWRTRTRWLRGKRPASDKLVAGNAALAPWLANQPMPGEERPEPEIRFGGSGLGQVTPPTGTVRTS